MLRRLIATERGVGSIAGGYANKSMAYRFLVVFSWRTRRTNRQVGMKKTLWPFKNP